MARDISPTTRARSRNKIVYPRFFVFLDYPVQTVRTWSGIRPKLVTGQSEPDFNGNYVASGHFLNIGDINEVAGGFESTGTNIVLSGISTENISLSFSNDYQNRAAKIWLVLVDGNDGIIEDPEPIFSGRMDYISTDDDEGLASVTIKVDSVATDLRRARGGRYTDEDQQHLYPGDKFFEFVPELINKKIVWGGGGGGPHDTGFDPRTPMQKDSEAGIS